MASNSPKRNRGFVLSQTGWEKLQARLGRVERERGCKLTKQALIKHIQLFDAQGLHPITLRKIMGRQIGVDERSLRLVFAAIGLELEAVDYQLASLRADQPQSDDVLLIGATSIAESEPNHNKVVAPFVSDLAIAIPDFPGGPLPLDSPFYLEPTQLLTSAYREISRPGGLVRIKAPQKSGKSSFALRLLHHAESLGYKPLRVDFQQVDEALFSNLDRFLRWFCHTLCYQLELDTPPQDYWNHEVGSKVSCTIYLQKALLQPLQAPVLLILNEVNHLFEHPAICQEFLPLLRSWYEEAKFHPVLQKLHFALVYSTEIYVPLHLTQSPFNIGLPIELEDFSLEEIQQLAHFYGLPEHVAAPLMELVGGQPYLIQLGLYHLYSQKVSLEQLLQSATATNSIYANQLRRCLANLQQEPELLEAFQQVLADDGQVNLTPEMTYKLESLGLIKLKADRVRPSCQLYQRFFSSFFSNFHKQEHKNRFTGLVPQLHSSIA